MATLSYFTVSLGNVFMSTFLEVTCNPGHDILRLLGVWQKFSSTTGEANRGY